MKKWDIIILVSALLLSGALMLITYLNRQDGGVAVVSVNGEAVGVYPLDEDTTVRIDGAEGGYNMLVIKDRRAYISDADCPDKSCVHQKAISAGHETIVCLPHRVVIEIQSDKENDTDAIAR